MSDTINASFGAPLFLSKSPIVPPIMPSNQYLPYNNNKPKVKPITYLIETEEEYIEDLRCLLQQVTKSWNRDNPPPPELEVMLSVLEEIYQHNTDFCSRLKQTGTDAEELGNALMAWIKEMEGPYSAYYQNYWRGVDFWPEIDNNLDLQQKLNFISAQRNQPVTLDFLFEVPLKRIHYYKKLYTRILKSSEPGRPDYDILEAANKRIDSLIELEKKAREINKPRENPSLPVLQTFTLPVNNSQEDKTLDVKTPRTPRTPKTPKTPIRLTLPEFENQLDTSRAMDLFTKQPKTVDIQLLPPNLPFKREIILNNDFIVILSDGEGSNKHKAHVNAHLILFTDLLLICQPLTSEEKMLNPTKDFWLLYPPLSGRHLTFKDMYDSKDDLLNLVVLERESMVLVAENKSIKEEWLKEFTNVIEFAKTGTATSTKPQIQISTQDIFTMGPSTGNFLTERWSPGLLSPGMKVGLPISPLSNGLPLRSRSPDQNNSPKSLQAESTTQTQRADSIGSFDSVSSIATFTETIQQTPPCEVSCWVFGEWVPVTKKEKCIVEIRMTSLNKPCWVVLLESSGRMILNAWIHPTTSIQRESSNSISVSCDMGQNNEFYKMTLTDQIDSDKLFSNFFKMRNSQNNELVVPQGFVSRSSSLKHNQQQQPTREIEQTMTDVMESKVKLFLQSDHGIWTNLGWGNMILLLETPSHRKRIIIQPEKQKSSKLIDAFICESDVGKVNKSVTFKINIADSTFIYMMQMKNEASATKALEIMKTRAT